ncbi:MAG: cell division ATP-binding protein FtsE [Candidatus Falkowbacteria bacterium]
MIRFRNVTKHYDPNVYALRDFSLHIKPQDFVSIVGKSGAGKTTLIKLLTAEERPTKGKIIVGGWDITDINHREIPFLRRQIGVIFQNFRLLPNRTAFENIAFALQVCGAAPQKVAKIVPQILKIVGLGHKQNFYPHQLSGGEQQRVGIARALIHRPKILLADEPTGNLDAINEQEIINLLKKINELGTTVILVTHNKGIVNSLRKRVITMDSGELINDQHHGKYII